MQVPFSPPDLRDDDIEAVINVLRSGWITSGPVGEKFRTQLTEFSGSAGTVLVNSATAALEAALRYLGIGPGDEVIVPAYTYTASASVIHHVGATIVMVDVEQGSYFMSAESIAAAITPRTKAVIAVDLAGRMVDTAPLYEVVESARGLFIPASPAQEAFGRIAVIIDGAHSLGAVREGKRSGSVGDFTAFSFHAVKNLTTAEGGAITWRKENPADSEDIEQFLKLHILHGQSKSALEKTNSAAWEYDVMFPGYKANMPDTLAALGLSQLQRYPETIARRHQIIESYTAALSGLPCTPLAHQGINWQSSGHLYMLSLDSLPLSGRNDFIERMYQRGVSCNVHYKTLPMLTAYKNLGFHTEDFPNAYNQYAHEVTLPLHTVLTDEQVEYVGHTARTILTEMTA
ncbi:MAG: DegT/DnrJ/EryC1/StrS aminotransferase family protein [Arcanobacterium sp.]|nr:DegT/DnrJ/EryC1/StrS aminotransferase family protein [Arcanobacterium sp.]